MSSWLHRAWILVLNEQRFIHTICRPDELKGHNPFAGDLGAWTPCFIDLALIGLGHVFAIICYLSWIVRITHSNRPDRFRLLGRLRYLHQSLVLAAVAATAIPLFQLNARLAEQSVPDAGGIIAPHEWAGLSLAALSYLLLCIILVLELQDRMVITARWLVRAPLVLVATSEVVKLRFVVVQQMQPQAQDPFGYFFWLYCTFVAVQVYLAIVLLSFYRDDTNLQLVKEGSRRYMPLANGPNGPVGEEDERHTCPEWGAGVFSALTFSWLSPLIRAGYKTPLTDKDIWRLPPSDRVGAIDVRFREAWDNQLQKKGPKKASLFAACASAVGPLFLAALPFKLINDASQFVGPTILNRLLTVVAAKAAAGNAARAAAMAAATAAAAVNGTVTATTAGNVAGAAAGNVVLQELSMDWPQWLEWLDAPLQNGYCLALLLFTGTVVGVLADNQHFQRVMRAGFRLKSIVTAEVYRKVLMLAPSERSHLTAGKLFNLVSSDANTLNDFCANAFGFLSAPLRIIVTMVFLWKQLGASALVAICCIAAAVPINSKLVAMSTAKLKVALKHGDTRAKLETELVTGMEVVKASTWEQPFHKRISAARALELAVLRTTLLLQSLMGLLVNTIPTIIPVISFLAYLLLMRQPLSAAQAFTALSLFNILRFPLFQLPQIVTQATQARVALGRLHDLLTAKELPPTVHTASSNQPSAVNGPTSDEDGSGHEAPVAIRLHGDFTWDPDMPPTLTGLNLEFHKGQLVAVVGPTGSGKTSLMSATLGLLQGVTEDEEGKGSQQVTVVGSTAYVPQTPFILGGTVRENILFGRPYEEQRYRRAVQAAQLEPDLAMLPGGDLTELGDRGTNISGGQKQRVAIARALYADADVVLLDDPLSALDSRVGRAVAQQAIKQVLADKTVVLATNQLQFVSMADVVVVMRGGTTVEVGSYTELLAANGIVAALMKEAQAEDHEMVTSGSDEEAEAAKPAEKPAAAAAAGPVAGPPAGVKTGSAQGGKLTQEEQSATGGVTWAVVSAYGQALGGCPAVVVLLSGFVLAELCRVGSTVWLSVWTGQEHGEGEPEKHSSLFYMGIYAAISGAQLVMLQINFMCVVKFGIRAGKLMHEKLLSSLLRAPMSFYHTTPTGRIVNRLTKDTADIDRNLAGNLSFAFRAFLQLMSTVIMIAVGAPFALPALLVMMGVFYALYQYFMASVRQAKRLEAVSRSPVLSSVNEAINGLATIRAFNIGAWLIARNRDLVDKNAATSLLNQSLNRWLSVRLEGLGAFCTLLAALVTVEQQSGNAATMGLLLSYALQITIATSMTLRVGSMAEQTFNAVERVEEYCHLPEEAAYDKGPGAKRGTSSPQGSGGSGGTGGSAAAAGGQNKRGRAAAEAGSLREPLLPVTSHDASTTANGDVGSGGSSSSSRAAPAPAAAGPIMAVDGVAPEGWPREASIEFSEVKSRYRPGLPLVLCGLSFKVDPGFKVGVVGRTGAGKSSLIGALFRLTEIESGFIAIDNVNTKSLGLKQLRSAMALIPQVPVLFTGSIRENLAPFGGHSDSALWSALRRAHLAPVVEGWAAEGLGGLDFVLGEGGSPLSAGQKQLLALARALLNPAKILVLDEATANVDVETDALIQETLRTEFSDRTLLAVAHRLHTIIEADRVLVMDKGRALEYGRPADLLENDDGAFTGMVRETGEATEKFLRSMAAGDAAAKKELEEAAAAALANVTLPCSTSEPSSMAALASNLAQGAYGLNRQLQGLLASLRSASGDQAAANAAANEVANVAAAAAGLSSGASMNRLLSLAASGSLSSPQSSNKVGGTEGSGDGDSSTAANRREALEELTVALAAVAQLQQVAAEAMQLLGMPVETVEAVFQHTGAAAGAPGDALTPQHSAKGGSATPASPFAELLGQAGGPDSSRPGLAAGPDAVRLLPGTAGSAAISPLNSMGSPLPSAAWRPSSFTSAQGPGGVSGWTAAGAGSPGGLLQAAASMRRRMSVDNNGSLTSSGGSAALRGAAGFRGRYSVDLTGLGSGEAGISQRCPNLAKCEKEQLAAMARQQQE